MLPNLRPTEIHYVTVFASLVLGLAFFFVLILPDILTRHWLHRECFVTESSVTSQYCCESTCSSCREVYPYSPLCGSLVERTHLEKNLSQCLIGERKFCADEGAFCDGGYYCCEWGYSIPGNSNSTWICYRSVNHRACRLHCPTCYTSRIAYTYERWCADGICRNMTVYKDKSHGRNKEAAEKVVVNEPLGCRKDCWVNPNDSQQIQFRGRYRWWAILLVILAWAPAGFVILLFLSFYFLQGCEFAIEKWVNWRFRNALMETSGVRFQRHDAEEAESRPILRRWREDEEDGSGNGSSDPPPKYEEVDNS